MRTRIVLLVLICVVAGCDLLPQKPINVTEQTDTRLCSLAGYYFTVGDGQSFQNVKNELGKRNALGPDCVTLAQIEINRVERDQARRDAYAQALNQMSRNAQQRANQPIYTPQPQVNCTSTQVGATTTTNCH